MLKSLPVLMYHSISPWPNPITVAPEVFEEHLAAMSGAGWKGIGLDEAADYLARGWDLPDRTCLITFDDGYLDNHVFAAPLLKQHGHRGVVFAVTGKLVDEALPRPTLEDVWNGFVDMRDLPQMDTQYARSGQGLRMRRDLFMSWKEAGIMDQGGTMAVEAHSHRHRSVFVSQRFETLMEPALRRRTFDRLDHEIVFGLPDFKRGPALGGPAWLPSEELYAFVKSRVPQDRGQAREFFERGDEAHGLLKELSSWPAQRLGRLETEREAALRMRAELLACRDALEIGLGRAPRALAWPWGTYCQAALDQGRELGFEVFFCTDTGPNPPAKRPGHVHRFKARNKSGKWLMGRLGLYAKPLMAKAYSLVRK